MARSSEAGRGEGRDSSFGDGSGEAVGVTVEDERGLSPEELLGRRRLGGGEVRSDAVAGRGQVRSDAMAGGGQVRRCGWEGPGQRGFLAAKMLMLIQK